MVRTDCLAQRHLFMCRIGLWLGFDFWWCSLGESCFLVSSLEDTKIEIIFITIDKEQEDPSGYETVEGGYRELKKKPVCQNGLHYYLTKQTNVPNQTHDVHTGCLSFSSFNTDLFRPIGPKGRPQAHWSYSDSGQMHASPVQGCGSFQQLSSLFLPSPPYD